MKIYTGLPIAPARRAGGTKSPFAFFAKGGWGDFEIDFMEVPDWFSRNC